MRVSELINIKLKIYIYNFIIYTIRGAKKADK